MNLDVHFMALLIVPLLQMERIYLCLKCCIECDMPRCVRYVVFQSPTYMKAPLYSSGIHLFANIHFTYNYCLFKILDCICKNKIGVLAHVK